MYNATIAANMMPMYLSMKERISERALETSSNMLFRRIMPRSNTKMPDATIAINEISIHNTVSEHILERILRILERALDIPYP